jgi:hypothetical protein
LPSAQATAAAVPQNLPGHYKGGSIEEKSLGIHVCTRMDMEGELDADGNFKGFAHVKWSTSGKTFLNNDAHLNVTGIIQGSEGEFLVSGDFYGAGTTFQVKVNGSYLEGILLARECRRNIKLQKVGG